MMSYENNQPLVYSYLAVRHKTPWQEIKSDYTKWHHMLGQVVQNDLLITIESQHIGTAHHRKLAWNDGKTWKTLTNKQLLTFHAPSVGIFCLVAGNVMFVFPYNLASSQGFRAVPVHPFPILWKGLANTYCSYCVYYNLFFNFTST